MNITLTIDTKDLDKAVANFDRMVTKALKKAMLVAEFEAKRSFGQPGKLKSRSGRLRASVKSGRVGLTGYLSSNVKYAPTHEYGATILPIKGKYLKFQIDKQWKTVRKVVIPARPFLGPAISDNISKIGKVLIDEIAKDFNNE